MGYSVSCGVRDTYGVLGFGFQIVSSSHSIPNILEALFIYIKSLPMYITTTEASFFDNNIKALISLKSEPPITMSESTEANWMQIEERRLNFSLKQEQLHILNDKLLINQDTMKEFCEILFLNESTTKLMVVEASPPLLLKNNIPATNEISATKTTAKVAVTTVVARAGATKENKTAILIDSSTSLETLSLSKSDLETTLLILKSYGYKDSIVLHQPESLHSHPMVSLYPSLV